MVQNSKILGHLIIQFPMGSGVRERVSERMSAAERVSKESIVKQAVQSKQGVASK